MSGTQNDMKYVSLDVKQPITKIVACLSINIRGSLPSNECGTLQARYSPRSGVPYYDHGNPVESASYLTLGNALENSVGTVAHNQEIMMTFYKL